jgi:hypothetical protein
MGSEKEKHYSNEEIHDFIVTMLPRTFYQEPPKGSQAATDWLRGKKETYPPPCSWKAFCYAVAIIGDTRDWVGKDAIALADGSPYRVKKLLERTMALNEVMKKQSRDLDMQTFLESSAEKHPIITDLNLATMIVSLV